VRLRAAALAVAWCCGAAAAQTAPAAAAVPFYTAAHFMQGLHRHWMLPRASAFAAEAAALAAAVERACAAPGAAALRQARLRWQSTAAAWDTLSAVTTGPLLQRRSLREIDFMPTRPELIARAIRAQPSDAQAMERIGTPAKGLPALEWLLWTQPVAAGTPGCRYAVRVAAQIDTEGTALAQAFAVLAARGWAWRCKPSTTCRRAARARPCWRCSTAAACGRARRRSRWRGTAAISPSARVNSS
jgi:hypothetical protein